MRSGFGKHCAHVLGVMQEEGPMEVGSGEERITCKRRRSSVKDRLSEYSLHICSVSSLKESLGSMRGCAFVWVCLRLCCSVLESELRTKEIDKESFIKIQHKWKKEPFKSRDHTYLQVKQDPFDSRHHTCKSMIPLRLPT